MIAVYYILKALNLTQSLLALILVYSAGAALGFYVAKGFFDTIPMALDESAMIDGANKWHIFTKITLPLSKPIIVYTSLMAFMGPWMDFIFARIIMGDDVKNYTVAIGLLFYDDKNNSQFVVYVLYSWLCADRYSNHPTLYLYAKYYVQGITSGSVK